MIYIILINYNGFKDTADCVDSIKESNMSANIRIVIVDNASPDGSGERLKEKYKDDKQITVLPQAENRGFSAGNNIGAEYACGEGAEYIVFLNNDTVADKSFLDGIIDYYNSDRSIGMITGKILYYDQPKTIWYAGGVYNPKKAKAAHIGSEQPDDGQYDDIKEITFCCGCYLLMSAENFKKIGPMPGAYFLYCEDLEYSLRAMRAGYKIIYYPESRIYHKVSASTGKASSVLQYYNTRNSLLFVKRNCRGIRRFYLYIYQIYRCCKRAYINHYQTENVLSGFKDFLLGREGKR